MTDKIDPVAPRTPESPAMRVEGQLRELIADLEPGAHLPTVRELAGQLNTSPATVGKVIQRLAKEGLIMSVHGWGSFKR